MSKRKPPYTSLGGLRIYPARRGKVMFWLLEEGGDLVVGPPPIIGAMFRQAVLDAVFKHRGVGHSTAYWWNVLVSVPESGAAEVQSVLQWWGRLCYTWPGAGAPIYYAGPDLLAVAPPAPAAMPATGLTLRAERLRAIDERLFRLAASRQDEVHELLDEVGALGHARPPGLFADLARFSALRGMDHDARRNR